MTFRSSVADPALMHPAAPGNGDAAVDSPADRDGLVHALERFGTATALVEPAGGEVSYAELAARVLRRSREFPSVHGGRRMIAVIGSTTVDFVVDYLAAFAAGHVVLVAPPGSRQRAGILHEWGPDLVVGHGERIGRRAARRAPRFELHPDLALLLSTSGSTGSPKLVRLSRRAVLANAAAIADYLDVRPSDRAITTLPMHYCYGLSVLHSHLLRGASLVLEHRSVTDPGFWDRAAAQRVTTFAGVPHTFEMIDAQGLDLLDRVPTLRYLTQAGGKMAPELVRRLAGHLAASGAELFVMYGQTEATARMGYLPPHLAAHRPEAVGIAIPGGEFHIAPPPDGCDGDLPDDVGELVYRGANVMMGYARTADELALPAEIAELHTGDLARIADDGLVEIVGRMGRERKIFGTRVDLGRVEAALAAAGDRVTCVATPDRLVLATTDPGHAAAPDALARRAAEHAGLAASVVHVHPLDELPRTAAGKVDHRALERLLHHDDVARNTPSAIVAAALRTRVEPSASFASAGGDSLSYVALTARLATVIPELPADWHLVPLAELDARAAASVTRRERPEAGRSRATSSSRARAARLAGTALEPAQWLDPRRWIAVDVGLVLRAVFIVTIVGTHARVFDLSGGAHALFALLGYSMARYGLQASDARDRARNVARTARRIALPGVVWLLLVTPLTSRYHWYNPLLLTNVLGPDSWFDDRWWNPWQMWFLEASVYALVVTAAVLWIPAVSAVDRRYPLALPGAVLAAGLVFRVGIVDLGGGPQHNFSFAAVLWLFGAGWAIARARSAATRVLLSVVVVWAASGWMDNPRHEALLAAGLLVLIWLPRVSLPAPVLRLLSPLAAASLFVYLTHFLVYPPIRDAGYETASMLLCFAVGIGAWWAWERAAGALSTRWTARRDG